MGIIGFLVMAVLYVNPVFNVLFFVVAITAEALDACGPATYQLKRVHALNMDEGHIWRDVYTVAVLRAHVPLVGTAARIGRLQCGAYALDAVPLSPETTLSTVFRSMVSFSANDSVSMTALQALDVGNDVRRWPAPITDAAVASAMEVEEGAEHAASSRLAGSDVQYAA